MSDPSFILNGSASRELREMARDLQALLDSRSAALEQPVVDADLGELAQQEGEQPAH